MLAERVSNFRINTGDLPREIVDTVVTNYRSGMLITDIVEHGANGRHLNPRTTLSVLRANGLIPEQFNYDPRNAPSQDPQEYFDWLGGLTDPEAQEAFRIVNDVIETCRAALAEEDSYSSLSTGIMYGEARYGLRFNSRYIHSLINATGSSFDPFNSEAEKAKWAGYTEYQPVVAQAFTHINNINRISEQTNLPVETVRETLRTLRLIPHKSPFQLYELDEKHPPSHEKIDHAHAVYAEAGYTYAVHYPQGEEIAIEATQQLLSTRWGIDIPAEDITRKVRYYGHVQAHISSWHLPEPEKTQALWEFNRDSFLLDLIFHSSVPMNFLAYFHDLTPEVRSEAINEFAQTNGIAPEFLTGLLHDTETLQAWPATVSELTQRQQFLIRWISVRIEDKTQRSLNALTLNLFNRTYLIRDLKKAGLIADDWHVAPEPKQKTLSGPHKAKAADRQKPARGVRSKSDMPKVPQLPSPGETSQEQFVQPEPISEPTDTDHSLQDEEGAAIFALLESSLVGNSDLAGFLTDSSREEFLDLFKRHLPGIVLAYETPDFKPLRIIRALKADLHGNENLAKKVFDHFLLILSDRFSKATSFKERARNYYQKQP